MTTTRTTTATFGRNQSEGSTVAFVGLAESFAVIAAELSGVVAAALEGASAIIEDWKLRRRVRQTAEALQNLDNRTLADIGLTRSQIQSVATAQVYGRPFHRSGS